MTGFIPKDRAIELGLQFRSDLTIVTIARGIEELDFMERQTLWRLLQTRFPISIDGESWQTETDDSSNMIEL